MQVNSATRSFFPRHRRVPFQRSFSSPLRCHLFPAGNRLPPRSGTSRFFLLVVDTASPGVCTCRSGGTIHELALFTEGLNKGGRACRSMNDKTRTAPIRTGALAAITCRCRRSGRKFSLVQLLEGGFSNVAVDISRERRDVEDGGFEWAMVPPHLIRSLPSRA